MPVDKRESLWTVVFDIIQKQGNVPVVTNEQINIIARNRGQVRRGIELLKGDQYNWKDHRIKIVAIARVPRWI